jgi:hypothetical protein
VLMHQLLIVAPKSEEKNWAGSKRWLLAGILVR